MAPTNNLVCALLTDTYQITMTYAHWKTGKHEEPAVFELFFRKNPFRGSFTIFCGLDEVLKHLETFSFSQEDVDYLKSTPSLANCEDEFFQYLVDLNTINLTVRAMEEGSVAFPRIPLLVLEAPLGLGQLLETTLLNLINYPSLIATNAARMVLRANPAPCIEFGLRRAQGPDGACSASKYSYVGGFAATSNVLAGKLFGIPISGTHAHAYVQAFASVEEVKDLQLLNKKTGTSETLLPHVLKHQRDVRHSTNPGELAAFVAYACAFPDVCLCLIDTYDTLKSGLPNFISVALALDDFGYRPKGIRLDSGDLAKLSLECAKSFESIAKNRETFKDLTIVVSNDINEKVLQQLTQQRHGITAFGIGTNLVTCQAQPALGCVYKLVEWNGKPRIKVSQDLPKVTIPGRKRAFRLFGQDGQALVDFLILADEEGPQVGKSVTCRDPFQAQYRFQVLPAQVLELHSVAFANGSCQSAISSLDESRRRCQAQLETLPPPVTSYVDPQDYPVMVSVRLFQFLHDLWEREAPMEHKC